MKNVLVIEDNEDNLRLITYALQRGGYGVLSSRTGEEGIELALREKLCFIIMDINLPGIDGIETTIRIRRSEAGKSVPIIAMTSYAMQGDQERIMKAGCTGYIEKPIDPLTIIDKMQKIVTAGGERV